MLKFTELENGNLRISLEDGYSPADLLDEVGDDIDSDFAFIELTEFYWANGWGVHRADDLGQLSECLVISKEAEIENDGSITLSGKAWSNVHNYMIVSHLREIVEKGYYDFLFWQEFQNDNFPRWWEK